MAPWVLSNTSQDSFLHHTRVLSILGRGLVPWCPEAAKAGRAPGGRLSSSPSTLLRITKGKSGRKALQMCSLTARAGEVGLAVSRNDPNTLRAGPFRSRLENPPERVGPYQLLGKMSFQSFRASSPCFPLIQAADCIALCCRPEAGARARNQPSPSSCWRSLHPEQETVLTGDSSGHAG